MNAKELLILVCLVAISAQLICCQLMSPRNIPRIGRSSDNNKKINEASFQKFFLKASKSVPRIGRRSSIDEVPTEQRVNLNYPSWSDLPEMYEYNPELFAEPKLIGDSEYEMMSDWPYGGDWNRIRYKREVKSPRDNKNQEIMEYRVQPEKHFARDNILPI